jgi:hypothetical protein
MEQPVALGPVAVEFEACLGLGRALETSLIFDRAGGYRHRKMALAHV